MTVFDMLKELQEQPRDNPYDSWILVWSPHWDMWVCSLIGWDDKAPGWENGTREQFMAEIPYDCVHKAWKSEKEARSA